MRHRQKISLKGKCLSLRKFFNISHCINIKVTSMGTKLSSLYGMDIFTDSGKFVGNAQDFILDFETGEVSRILLQQLPTSKDDAKKALRDLSVLYKNVKSVDDVFVVTTGFGSATQSQMQVNLK